MSNMNYCRHENTSQDLQDIINKWWEFEDESEGNPSEYEESARRRIPEQCVELLEMIGYEIKKPEPQEPMPSARALSDQQAANYLR